MNNLNFRIALLAVAAMISCIASGTETDTTAKLPAGWSAQSPRDEIRPAFSYQLRGGPHQNGSFIIEHDRREGLDGWVQKTFPVQGGEYVRFQAVRKLTNVAVPRRSALVRVLWKNDAGKMVSADVPATQVQEWGHTPSAEPEHPADGPTDASGWTAVTGVYRVPPKATQAIVELHLQWAPQGRAEWSEVALTPTSAPVSRNVKLATIHHQPSGRSSRENCEEFAPLLEKAAHQHADLVVLGETVPTVGVKGAHSAIDTAEPIPGPVTEYFGTLAKQHQLHIALSMYERDRHLVYNTAVLLGPEGQLIGKYRKVCLPHGEVEKGISPGSDYPVFTTKFGKVGLMVCYDGFFPEVARELSNRGAEVIAWPVWGCNPKLATARACENHVYVVSSTYMKPKDGWMISAVFDQTGRPLAQADNDTKVAVAEVDLGQPYIGPWNLGDFHSMLPRHRPCSAAEPVPTAIPAKPLAKPRQKKVAVLLFDGVELMDFAGPAEVFITADKGQAFRVVTVAESKQPLKTMGGIVLTPECDFTTAPQADIVIVPGGNLNAVGASGRRWLQQASANAEVTMSVCYGALLLADVGLLDGLEATTHHWGIDTLKTTAPKCKVLTGQRFVASGKIVTTAGVTAGIDGALHIVERLLGKEAATWTAEEWMEHPRRN